MDIQGDKTVLLTGAKQADEMQVVWSKSDVVRALSGKIKVSPPEKTCSFKIVDGPDKGKVYPLEGKSRFTLGRGVSDIILKDSRVSKIHCMVEFYDTIVVIKDMNSTNGSLLNQFVLAEDFLKDKDRLRIGNTVLEFQVRKS
ncbi:MAG: FHA domain-containing protein [Nitrospiria bacterium]